MASMLQNQPFKNREHVIAEIKRCALAGGTFTCLSFLFAALGVIGDALNTTLGLEPMSWFLLAIFSSVHAIVPDMHLVVAKHLLGIEAESKKE
jgi:ubiquinone/menaquinone biosynthesis C-methylase UbiE